MLARRTIVFFALSIASFAFLAYRAYESSVPCSEWRRAHPTESPAGSRSGPNGSATMSFSPCSFIVETTTVDKVGVLAFLISIVGFFTYLANYLWMRIKIRRLDRGGDF